MSVIKKIPQNSEILTRAVDKIITPDELRKKLDSGKQLRIKFGADVTASSLHIGHAVNLWKMREFQERGHKVVFLVGDFTTRTGGDPTDRLEARSKIAAKNIEQWTKNFIKEIGRVLLTDKKVFEVRRNSEWYSKMKAGDLLDLLSLFTHSRLIERDMFQRRIKEGKEIWLPELLYPVLQGYDSVMLKSDLTIIGSDQLFNEGVGRFLQEKFGQPPQALITTVITPGLDGGEKMSKSRGNYIGLSDSPQDKFGKAMRILDSLIIQYLEIYTDTPMADIRKLNEQLKRGKNPRDAKLFFAEALARRYHGEAIARKERERFLKIFSERQNPKDAPVVKVSSQPITPVDLLVKSGLVSSKSEARRLVAQRAMDINGRTISDLNEKIIIRDNSILKLGKKKFIRLKMVN